MIKKCGCTGDKAGNTAGANFQDQKYGKGNRIVNETNSGYRCTVCGFDVAGETQYGKKK